MARRRMRRVGPGKRGGTPWAKYAGYAGTAVKALSLATKVASMVNAEKNHLDFSGSYTPSTTAAIIPFGLMAEGTDVGQRIGRSIKLAGLSIRWLFNGSITATGNQNIRVMFLRDNWGTGNAPAVTDVLVGQAIYAFRNVDTTAASRFSVLYDKVIIITDTDGDQSSKMLKLNFKLKNHVTYYGTTATQANLGKGAIYAMIFTDTAANNAVASILDSRMWYYDN
ncbi:capsid protein [Vehemenivirus recresis]|uniref:Capsid protein n=1 Tax=Circovirus sp. TaxID=1964372 RepID=A0A2K9YN99_9CIRC|nr:capsid protein [Circovirus sp.]